MKRRVTPLVVAGVAILSATASYADIIPIDLNDFSTPFPEQVIGSCSPNGSCARLTSLISLDSLQNDPAVGDPDVIIPGAGVSLIFDYEFFPLEDGPAGPPSFWAFLTDNSSLPLDGFPIPGFEFLTTTAGSGSVEFDLSSLTALTLGMAFLVDGNSRISFESVVIISDLRLVTTQVPEPSTLALLSLGLLGLGLSRSRKQLA